MPQFLILVSAMVVCHVSTVAHGSYFLHVSWPLLECKWRRLLLAYTPREISNTDPLSAIIGDNNIVLTSPSLKGNNRRTIKC